MDFGGGAPAKDSIRRCVERVYGFSDNYCVKILNDCLNGVSGDGAVVAKRCYILHSLMVGHPLSARWVVGSNPVDGKSLNESWEICLCSGVRLVISGYSDENQGSCKQELA